LRQVGWTDVGEDHSPTTESPRQERANLPKRLLDRAPPDAALLGQVLLELLFDRSELILDRHDYGRRDSAELAKVSQKSARCFVRTALLQISAYSSSTPTTQEFRDPVLIQVHHRELSRFHPPAQPDDQTQASIPGVAAESLLIERSGVTVDVGSERTDVHPLCQPRADAGAGEEAFRQQRSNLQQLKAIVSGLCREIKLPLFQNLDDNILVSLDISA
jgi:hypothetical protein